MNYASYTGTIKNNLCDMLTRQKDTREKIIKLRESIEIILSVPYIEQSTSSGMIFNELNRAIEFYKKINSAYNEEIMRLTKILLDKQH